MSLIKTWAPYFQSSVRMKGRTYQAAGRVKQVPPHEGELVRAEVQGREPYTVTIEGTGPSARVHCTCPHFADGHYCKHIWATMLDVQYNGFTAGEPAVAEQPAPGNVGLTPPKARKREKNQTAAQPREPDWVGRLHLLRGPVDRFELNRQSLMPAQRQIAYVVSPDLSARHQGLVIELRQREVTRRGWGRMKRLRLNRDAITRLHDPADRELCALIVGGLWVDEMWTGEQWHSDRPRDAFRLVPGAWRTLLKRLIATQRCFGQDDDDAAPLTWDGDEPWRVWLVGTLAGDALSVTVELRRDGRQLPIDLPDLVLTGPDGLMIYDEKAAPLDDAGAARWVSQFRDELRSHGQSTPIRVPIADVPRFLDRLYMLPQLPPIDLPVGIGRPEEQGTPQPQLELYSLSADTAAGSSSGGAQAGAVGAPRGQTLARVGFVYGEHIIRPGDPGRYVAPAGDGDEAGQAAGEADQAEGGAISERAPRHVTPPPADADAPLIRRDLDAERDAVVLLAELGFHSDPGDSPDALLLAAPLVSHAVAELSARGWRVTADDRVVRTAATPQLTITSNIDWFELRGGFRFDTADGHEFISLPDILAAARQGRTMVALGDGSHGMLPQDWLARHGLLTAVGKLEGDALRFKTAQAAMIDALLAEQDLTHVDEKFQEARQRLHSFERIEPVHEGDQFIGTLRNYQRGGLGWFDFLRWLNAGGILADDMGLGKTVQVLAMLDVRSRNGHEADNTKPRPAVAPPSLIVAPRSVVFNWLDEAERFTPHLRVAPYTGTERHALRDAFDQYDMIVTSYGLMRRDIAELRQCQFDYVVLDEAQAIKNPASQAAKAARLLKCNHRLALTGTPVENHLGDLWSIFEFLNPGLLGSRLRFAELVRGVSSNGGGKRGRARGVPHANPKSSPLGAGGAGGGGGGGGSGQFGQGLQSVQLAQQAGRALRPFILRRTKQQVLTELPEKTEQTIICEMGAQQRKVYDELLTFYRTQLLDGRSNGGGAGVTSAGATGSLPASAVGSPSALNTGRQAAGGTLSGGAPSGGVLRSLGKPTMLVIEALLRLRQAACHPALIDPQRTDIPSAKLEALLENLAELIDEGHKALVFSQFTSMLALVRTELDKTGVTYEYLDGQTRDRRACVQRFQNDPDVPVFLISLKAGGFGLNLTAASYVFILDPWWNPAVEQQAIDRAHRIGQTRAVTAYRLICQNTVEQRIAELQARKKELADAIVGGQDNLLSSLTKEDLEVLLS
jgi:superfamily II DNA or RNA helicase